ncbi:elicitor-responsive protein 3 [Senna tora]|uniref:Elicitor-responsive protein 3 n=1 Tax=Senna tora TaxID=362788 RepID=A0A834XJN2_9FABA|nr:elicitor-responsive protein 3 [Senna tora]
MKTGILEVLLVNAEGIIRTNLIGTPSYYVIIECGSQSQRSKISSGKHEKPWWNEKFTFEISSFDDSNNMNHLKFTIMDTELFTNGGFVGETRIYIGGMISDSADDRECIEIKPIPYNVVLEDDTYKGQIKIGFKFILNKEKHVTETRELIADEKESIIHSICGSIMKLCKISWWKISFFNNKKSTKNKNRRS